MKKKLFYILVITASIENNIEARAAVTYDLSGGRLGDNFLSYLHAKWVSYKYNIELLYKPFTYSDQLRIHDIEKPLSAAGSFNQVVYFKKGDSLVIDPERSVLYVVPYFPESLEEYETPDHKYFYFQVDWFDKKFVEIIRSALKPRTKIDIVRMPENIVTVGVHIRKNSNGFDLPLSQELPDPSILNPNQRYVDYVFPLKHPSDEYYIEQIAKFAQIFAGKKIYVFIFTDDINPKRIVDKYKSRLNNPDIIFDYRKNSNNHFTNVLEDFYSWVACKNFIRPDSNLSIAASKLGNYQILITPAHHQWINKRLVIDKVQIIADPSINLQHLDPEHNLIIYKK